LQLRRIQMRRQRKMQHDSGNRRIGIQLFNLPRHLGRARIGRKCFQNIFNPHIPARLRLPLRIKFPRRRRADQHRRQLPPPPPPPPHTPPPPPPPAANSAVRARTRSFTRPASIAPSIRIADMDWIIWGTGFH
jgi:hypothetical protein